MNTQTAKASPLLTEHQALGASFTDFAGWQMPIKYSSELAEHRAVREAAGIFDISHMGEIIVEGPEAAAALDFALVGELSKVAVGKAKYSLMCDHAGGVLDDLVSYRLADQQFLVVANASNTSSVLSELATRTSQFEVSVTDKSSEYALIAVQGPVSEAIIKSVAPESLAITINTLKYYAITPAAIAGHEVLLGRTGYTGEDGFEVYVNRKQAISLWRSLLEATTAHGGTAAGLACRDTLRLEAGMPLYGQELTVGTNPYEAGLGKVVRLNKDFVGRHELELIAQIPTNRTLIGLKGVGKRAARAGYSVHRTDTDGAIGTVTSGALSPTLGYPIAMAYVDSGVAQPGAELVVDIRGKKEPFEVTALPFYRRS